MAKSKNKKSAPSKIAKKKIVVVAKRKGNLEDKKKKLLAPRPKKTKRKKASRNNGVVNTISHMTDKNIKEFKKEVKNLSTQFATGNEFWKKRSTHGRDAIFADSVTMLKALEEYCIYTDSRKWYKHDFKGSLVEEVKIPTQVPYSMRSFCLFCDVGTQYFSDFKESLTYKNNPGFSIVINVIEETIANQQFEGASVGAYNSLIMVRTLKLEEHTVNKHELSEAKEKIASLFPDEKDFDKMKVAPKDSVE